MAALRRLPSAQREAIALYYLADLPIHEVATATGVTVGTVKSRLSRGGPRSPSCSPTFPTPVRRRPWLTSTGCFAPTSPTPRPTPSSRRTSTPIERRGVRRRRTRTLFAAAAVVVVLLGVVGSVRIFDPEESSAPHVVDQPPRSLPTGEGVVEPGTYLVPSSTWSAVDYSITFPEGWRVRDGNQFDTNSEQIDELGIQPFVVDKIYTDACQGDKGAQTQVVPASTTWSTRCSPSPARPRPARGDHPGRLPRNPGRPAGPRAPADRRTASWDPAPESRSGSTDRRTTCVLDPEGLLSIYVVDVDGDRAVFTSQYRPAHTSPEDKAELQQVLDSIQIEK